MMKTRTIIFKSSSNSSNKSNSSDGNNDNDNNDNNDNQILQSYKNVKSVKYNKNSSNKSIKCLLKRGETFRKSDFTEMQKSQDVNIKNKRKITKIDEKCAKYKGR